MPLAPDSDILLPGVVELPEVLDLKAATPLAVEFLTLRGRPINVDAAHVQRLGGLCLQVLLSAAIAWKADKLPFAFVNLSSDFTEGLARLGVSATDFTGGDKPQ
jgi:chemotaxis protein CheX